MEDARKLRRWLLLVIIACAALYLIGNGRVCLWDRDEGWYAQCSKQMWETGDWVVPRFLDKLRTEKPVFVYWLQLAGYGLFGGPSEFAVRFYAAVAQTGVLCILGYGLMRLVGPARAVWTAFIYGTCVMAIIAAKMCLTDATLMVFLITAQLCLLRFYLRGFSWKWFWLMAVAIGFGGLTKGPVVFVPPAATLLVLGVMDWKKWLPYVRPVNLAKWAGIAVLTVVIALAVCAPWLIVLQIREPQWIAGVLGTAAQHITQPLDNHRGPFGYYLLLMWGTFFPWSLLVPFAAYVAWKQRKEPYTRFAIAAAIGPWLFFEMMKTKLPHYPLPTYPFLGLLIADALVRTSTRQYLTLFKSWIVALVGVWAIPVGLGASAPWLALLAKPELLPLPYVPMTVVSLAGMACTIGTFWFFYRRRPLMACAYMGGSFIVLIGLLYGWLIPQCQYLRTSEKVVAILRENGGTAAQGAKVGDVLTLAYQIGDEDFGYSEPTLFFYQGGTMRPMDSDKYLEATPIEKWPKLVVITDGIMNRLPTELQQKIEVLGRVRGFAYSAGGRIVDVMVIRAKAGAQ